MPYSEDTEVSRFMVSFFDVRALWKGIPLFPECPFSCRPKFYVFFFVFLHKNKNKHTHTHTILEL